MSIYAQIKVQMKYLVFYCDIEVCENKYLGILQLKTDTGNIYPIGK